MKRFVVMARWGTDPTDPTKQDIVRKECKTKKSVLGVVGLLLREIKPYQISITDRNQDPIVEAQE